MPHAVLFQEYEHRVQNCSGLDEVARQEQIEKRELPVAMNSKTNMFGLHRGEFTHPATSLYIL